MSEIIAGRQVFSLFEVGQSIQRTLMQRYSSSFWVKAEMNKLNYYSHSGHCYPEILEKKDGKVIAQMKSVLWRNDYERINALFIKTLKEPLRDGITILFSASVVYDPSHGLSLKIQDIDPSFSLGELEREKIETIEKLKKEGIYNLNRSLDFPMLPKRIAVISVETSKGYADFLKVINQNTFGYRFFHFLFPALLQGEKAVDSIIGQLQRIRKVAAHFDVVTIIRGGGGDVGLSCYNHYRLSKEVAMFPLPVLSGIGHATNETVTELVSHKHFITPTEAAGFLLQSFHNFAVPLNQACEKINNYSGRLLLKKNTELLHTAKYFRVVTSGLLQNAHQKISQGKQRIHHAGKVFFGVRKNEINTAKIKIDVASKQFFKGEIKAIESISKQISLLDPKRVLMRGYSITLQNGKALQDAHSIKEGDVLETRLFAGSFQSTVNSIKLEPENE